MNEPNAKDFDDPILFSLAIQDWREETRKKNPQEVCCEDCSCGGQRIKAFTCEVITRNTLCRCGEAVSRLTRAQAFHEAGNMVSIALGFSKQYGTEVDLQRLSDSLHAKGLGYE